MAQLIQSNSLSPVQGSAGQFSPVVDRSPTMAEGLSNLTNQVGQMIDTAGNVYGQNRAEALVNEEIENIDRARAVAEKGEFTSGDSVPASLKVDQKEWDMISTAVQSGTMSREKARLIASSRLRARIAEEPFFADRMRKAASGILGFNIESEGARQYFASFPTGGQLASGSGSGNDILDDYREQAEAWAALGVIDDPQVGMQWLAKRDRVEAENEMAKFQASAGLRNANDMAGTLIRNHNSVAWGGFLGDLKATENETGRPVKPEEFSRVLRTQKQMFKERFDQSWTEAGGDLNSEDYNRHLSRINNEYQQMEDFVNEYGIDNVMKMKVDRQEQLFDLMGQQMFPQLTMITRTFGQQVTSDLINMSAMNPSKRALLMKQNPELAAAFNLMDQDPKQFTQRLMDVSTKLLNGEEFTEDDAPFVNYAAKELHKNGSQETKGSSIRGLAEQGLDWKGLSLLAESRAYLEPEVNKKYFKTQYEQGLPPAMQQLAVELQANPAINATVDEKGNVVVSQDSAGGAMPQTGPGGLVQDPQAVQSQIVAFNRAKQLADKVNLFTKGMSRGYDQVVGKSREQHTIDMRNMLNENVTNVQQGAVRQVESTFNTQVENGDIDAAQQTYNRLREMNPDLYTMTWEEMLNEAEQRARMELEEQ